jgi:Family of unknown function (DUF5947)
MTTLRELASPRRPTTVPAAQETCDLCGTPLAEEHRHLVDLDEQRLLCACRACTILFDRRASGGGHYRLVPDRSRLVDGLRLADERWASFAIPVSLAFFFRSSLLDRVVCFYPSPAGATESLLDLSAWEELEADNPVLATLEPDVEALLLDRRHEGAAAAFLAPIDECYALVGLMRSHWRGLSGGAEVWQEVEGFFERLRARAEPVSPDGKEATWQS